MAIKKLSEELDNLSKASEALEQAIEQELANLPTNEKGKFGKQLQEQRQKTIDSPERSK